jgi:hypothetical protein
MPLRTSEGHDPCELRCPKSSDSFSVPGDGARAAFHIDTWALFRLAVTNKTSCDTNFMAAPYKFGTPDPAADSGTSEWQYGNVWATGGTNGGGSRLVIAPAQGHIETLLKLLPAMTGPFWLLYVLVVPRGHAESGRYQSPEPQSEVEVKDFLTSFSGFLEKDGRHNLWIASTSSSQMLIYDRHNVIYAYGPLDAWKQLLAADAFTEVPMIRFPSPHAHHYHESLDSEEDRLLSYYDWRRTPLKSSDEN